MTQDTVAARGNYLCGESPLWDANAKKFYWCDLSTAKVYTLDKLGRRRTLFEGKNVGGFAVNRIGGFVCSTLQGVWLWEKSSGFRLVADEFGGEKLVCNDAIADPSGRFLFGSDYYDSYREYKLGKLFSMDKGGNLAVLDEGIHLSNGIGFSPDSKTLYYTDTGVRNIYAYDYDAAHGTASNRRLFVHVPEDQGIPDGLTVDAEGYVWSAQWYGSCVVRYDPDGKENFILRTPAKQTTSVMFGGEDLTDLYVTTASKPAWLPVIPPEYDYENAGVVGGPVYQYHSGIKGKAEFIADINPF